MHWSVSTTPTKRSSHEIVAPGLSFRVQDDGPDLSPRRSSPRSGHRQVARREGTTPEGSLELRWLLSPNPKGFIMGFVDRFIKRVSPTPPEITWATLVWGNEVDGYGVSVNRFPQDLPVYRSKPGQRLSTIEKATQEGILAIERDRVNLFDDARRAATSVSIVSVYSQSGASA